MWLKIAKHKSRSFRVGPFREIAVNASAIRAVHRQAKVCRHQLGRSERRINTSARRQLFRIEAIENRLQTRKPVNVEF
ncbi:hypothetical protein [Pontibacter vulgaris]|uniref:hypothetical protein n=1 Tax=Pontibacter vulgaris TaxID=2905679 RepID=UPI001FA79461|nr:hypothetical protein [Pontibacter vulgaris]